MRKSTWLWVGVVVALVVVTLVVLVLRRPAVYAEDTPEGVVQRYVQAVLDQDPEAALSWLALDVRSRCDNAMTYDMLGGGFGETRATLVDTTVEGDEATVRVRLSAPGGVLEGGYDHVEMFRLRRGSEGWRIDPAPWPIRFCDQPPGGGG